MTTGVEELDEITGGFETGVITEFFRSIRKWQNTVHDGCLYHGTNARGKMLFIMWSG